MTYQSDEKPDRPRSGYVYFVFAERLDMVKIGVAVSPEKRLIELQVASPAPLHMVGVLVSGDMCALERELHDRFFHRWSHGEWFHGDAEMYEFIENETDLPPARRRRRHQDKIRSAVRRREVEEAIAAGAELAPLAARIVGIKAPPPAPIPAPAPKPEKITKPRLSNSRKARMERYKLARGLAA